MGICEAYETRIDKLERKKLICQEKAGKTHQPKHSFEEMFELSIQFLSNPHKLWGSGKFNLQRTVLKLVFFDRLTYDRNEGFRTPKTALPFKVLGGFLVTKIKWCPGRELNFRHGDFQSPALPLSYPGILLV